VAPGSQIILTEFVMKLMHPDRVEAAIDFLHRFGRPIDAALFDSDRGQGSAAVVLSALESHQNVDGGFGHALEPDIRLDDSSVIATTVGLQILQRIRADASHPMVRGAIAYLLEQLDLGSLAWVNVPDHVDEAPHAPWWKVPDRPTGFTANPGAEIVSHFHHWPTLLPADLLSRLTDAAMDHLSRLAADQMHNILCFETMRKTQAVPQAARERVLEQIRPVVLDAVATRPEDWTGYSLRPLGVVDNPDSPYFSPLRDAVEANLDYLIETQQPDGSWTPHWSWGDENADGWQQARRDGQSVVTLENLGRLHAFGRLTPS
jgi:hypothetical protein